MPIYQYLNGVYNNSLIELNVKKENGDYTKLLVMDFLPYFYVPSEVTVPDNDSVVSFEDGYESIWGESLQKLVMRTPTDVGGSPKQDGFREMFAKHYEADLRSFIQRFMIDSGLKDCFEIEGSKTIITIDDIKPRNDISFPMTKAYIDIECFSGDNRIDPFNPEQKVICWSLKFSGHSPFLTVLLDESQIDKRVITKQDKDILITVNQEPFMFEVLTEALEKLKPTIVVSWSKYDFKTLKDRAIFLKLKNFNLDRCCWFDLCWGYDALFSKGSSRLKDMVVNEGISDEVISEEYHNEWWNNNNAFLVKYNRFDVDYMVWLDELGWTQPDGKFHEPYKITDFYWNLRCFIGSDNMDALFQGTIVDLCLLRKCFGKYILPSRAKDNDTEGYKGAIVWAPVVVGLYHNVAVFDMSRYYPNIIIAWNITPENNIDGFGILPQICKDLMEERDKYEAQLRQLEPNIPMYEQTERKCYMVKTILLAVYGYNGSPNSRIYKKENAEKITRIAREGLLYSEETIQKMKLKTYKVMIDDEVRDSSVIRADTDSLFIPIDDEKQIPIIMNTLNEGLVNWAKENNAKILIRLKYEKLYRSLLFVETKEEERAGKKQYAGRVVFFNGRSCDFVEIKGMDYIKRNTSKLTKNAMWNLINFVLYDEQKKAVPYLRELVQKMKHRDFSLEEIGTPRGLNKRIDDYKKIIPDYVRGSLYANKYLNQNIQGGTPVKMYYISRIEGLPLTDVICILDKERLPKGMEKKIFDGLDVDKFIDKTVKEKVDKILEVINVSWNQIERPTTLDMFR